MKNGLNNLTLDIANRVFCNNRCELYYPEWFVGKNIIGGSETRDFITRIFGTNQVKATHVVWERDHFEIRLFHDSVHVLTFTLTISDMNDFSIWHTKEGEYEHMQAFKTRLHAVVTKLKPYFLFQVLFKDFNKDISLHPILHFRNMTEFPYFEWGNELIQYMFMLPRMIRKRIYCLSIGAKSFSYAIDHTDIECANIDGNNKNVRWKYSFLQLDENNTTGERALDSQMRKSLRYSIVHDTDIIMGGDASMKKIIPMISDTDSNSMINIGCVPLIIGDDISSAVKNNKNVVYHDPVHDDPLQNNITIIQQLFESHKSTIDIHEHTINLVGYTHTIGMEEIIDILNQLDIHINCSVIPKYDTQSIEKFAHAPLTVLLNYHEYERLYESIFSQADESYVYTHAPFGFVRTKQWIQQIGDSLDVSVDAYFNTDHFNEMQARWDALREQCKEKTIGLVLTEADIELMVDPSKQLFGLPLISILEEMGFSIECALVVPYSRYGAIKHEISLLLSRPESHLFKLCSSTDELRLWLRRSTCTCMYSDINFDARAMEVGKTTFNVFDFEMGFAGAIRTAQRLLDKSSCEFYSRYKKYITYHG